MQSLNLRSYLVYAINPFRNLVLVAFQLFFPRLNLGDGVRHGWMWGGKLGRDGEEMLKNMNEIQKSATFVVCT